MLSADENENKPIGKPGQRKAKGEQKAEQSAKNGEPRKRKDSRPRAAKPDQLLEALERASTQVEEQVSEPIAEPIPEPIPEPMLGPTRAPIMSAESSPSQTDPTEPTAAAAVTPEAAAITMQTIANAYGDYSKKSFEQTSSFVAKLARAGSLDKALELQAAFARETYETFVAESRRIRALHSELAKQRLQQLEGCVAKMTQSALNPTRHT